MEQLILQPNSTAEWHALVSDTINETKITLPEDIESYLVFLLMRFTKDVDLAKKIVAIDFLEGQKQTGNQKQNKLRDVGDLCLLFSGLFPERALKRKLKVSYYVTIGQSAYNNLGQESSNSLANLFSNLSKSFVALMDILQNMRKFNSSDNLLEPLYAEEMWSDTGSLSALQTLQQYTTDSNIIVNKNINHDIKH